MHALVIDDEVQVRRLMTEALKEDLAAQLEAQQVPLAASGTESTVIADSKDTAGPQT